jgi:hypothetical protein
VEKQKRRRGDRRDGTLIRDIDPMHFFLAYLYRNRADNEAYISERIDLTNINAYLEKKNMAGQESPYTMFQIILSAFIKTVVLRPKMNRFIQGRRIYQRNELSAAFVVKKQFNDEAHEALAFLRFEGDATIDSIHDMIVREVSSCRGQKLDESTDAITKLMKLPRVIVSILVWFVMKLDYYGRVPKDLIGSDPAYSTVWLSNVGSIKLKCGYHHLTNWGTNSVFCLIGEKKMSPAFSNGGNVTMRETVDLGLTIDERIADGYYYAQTVRLLKKLLENPELLESPANTAVDY